MSNLTLLVAQSGGIEPAYVVSGILIATAFLTVIAFFIKRAQKLNLGPIDPKKLERVEKKAQQKEEARVLDIQSKIEKATSAPGLDATEILLNDGLDKARKTK